MIWRKGFEPWLYLEQEHQPVCCALMAVLADNAGQMQVLRFEGQAQFFFRFAVGASIGRFAHLGVQFASARTPKPAVWFAKSLQ